MESSNLFSDKTKASFSDTFAANHQNYLFSNSAPFFGLTYLLVREKEYLYYSAMTQFQAQRHVCYC